MRRVTILATGRSTMSGKSVLGTRALAVLFVALWLSGCKKEHGEEISYEPCELTMVGYGFSGSFRLEYDDEGRLLYQHSPNLRTAEYRYNEGRLTEILQAGGGRTVKEYDDHGNLIAQNIRPTQPLGPFHLRSAYGVVRDIEVHHFRTTYHYSADGVLLTRRTDWDPDDREPELRDRLESETSYRYGGFSSCRLPQIATAEGLRGCPVASTTTGLLPGQATFTYDEQGRLAGREEGLPDSLVTPTYRYQCERAQ